ncbi:sarcosine dehydrogenase, mitochondrial-like [Bradysia coprophila]|uniref:sarcosine dehydrogenase, mitochondrial-like n=1 Tax=Bradysia coprophila TaxID=38358 RepID=UPI00187DCA01|nr:sarcosine dehydrogenase, mitochondrial-like [Bradysia coprophila]
MFKCLKEYQTYTKYRSLYRSISNQNNIPKSADVVIIGGGSAGCYTLYHLAKQGVNCILLERFKLTCGTTWHTNGLMWRIRPNDVDIQLLNRSRDTILDIQENTEYDPGWIQNGGIFIARTKKRMDEYIRLSTIAKVFNIEHSMLSTEETLKIFPLLNPNTFVGSLHSPGDGIIDPTMLCNALTKLAIQSGKAQVIENCAVKGIKVDQNDRGVKRIIGVETDLGVINTTAVVNATGVWGRDLIEPHGITLPLVPMKHSYIVTESIKGIRGLPNIRDHDASIALRIQGETVCLGGYEKNPIILDHVENDSSFSLYDLDWETFDSHVDGAIELLPAFGSVGIKCTVCGPESFTPDHKPLLGPDPRLIGLFHNCGYNSAGMMFGGGCGEQLAKWIVSGRPEFHMFNFDVRRYTANQLSNKKWAIERSHESYAENYAMVFRNAQCLAGRNFKTDALQETLTTNGAVMEECHGYERPAFFIEDQVPVQPYDWYGFYGNELNVDHKYKQILKGDEKYEFSDHYDLIRREALSCRETAAVFNLSSFAKFFIYGPEAREALQWICTADVDKPINSVVYSCALNERGGVESDFTVTILDVGNGSVIHPSYEGKAYYVVAGGSSGTYLSHIKNDISKFNVDVHDATDEIGIISIQGPNSRKIVEIFSGLDLGDGNLPPYTSKELAVKVPEFQENFSTRLSSIGFVGEHGYEFHVERKNCVSLYNDIMTIGSQYGLKNAGFRALRSLSCERGYHAWGYDLRSDDTPIESNLEAICRQNGPYKGSNIVDKQRAEGVFKRLVYLTIDEKIPLWGLEGVFRNGKCVGHLRLGEFGYSINKSIGKSYISCAKGNWIDNEYLSNGQYEIDVLGQRYGAKLHLISPFLGS